MRVALIADPPLNCGDSMTRTSRFFGVQKKWRHFASKRIEDRSAWVFIAIVGVTAGAGKSTFMQGANGNDGVVGIDDSLVLCTYFRNLHRRPHVSLVLVGSSDSRDPISAVSTLCASTFQVSTILTGAQRDIRVARGLLREEDQVKRYHLHASHQK